MSSTSIEWTRGDDGSEGKTWNPTRGCDKVSPGCKHCYAETFAERWRGIAGHPYEQGFDLRLVPESLAAPFHWKKPRRIFVNSMSDLFHERVPNDYIAAVFGVMSLCPQHTFQILTKRADRMADWFEMTSHRMVETPLGYVTFAAMELFERRGDASLDKASNIPAWPLPNVHVGVSVENREYGLPRIDHLRKVPAAVRMLSIEPLLEDLGTIDLDGIGWVIVGSESGNGARPMNEDWVRSIRDQCAIRGVPFFYKQRTDGRKVISLPMLDGAQHKAFPVAKKAE